jgi:hypothetical protein
MISQELLEGIVIWISNNSQYNKHAALNALSTVSVVEKTMSECKCLGAAAQYDYTTNTIILVKKESSNGKIRTLRSLVHELVHMLQFKLAKIPLFPLNETKPIAFWKKTFYNIEHEAYVIGDKFDVERFGVPPMTKENLEQKTWGSVKIDMRGLE